MSLLSKNTNNIITSPSLREGRGGLKFILSGGGTGGHIYPAIAIANELKSRFPDAEFLFVGAKDKMEMQKVPQAGYEIEGLWIAGLQRKLTLQNIMFPFKLNSCVLYKAIPNLSVPIRYLIAAFNGKTVLIEYL